MLTDTLAITFWTKTRRCTNCCIYQGVFKWELLKTDWELKVWWDSSESAAGSADMCTNSWSAFVYGSIKERLFKRKMLRIIVIGLWGNSHSGAKETQLRVRTTALPANIISKFVVTLQWIYSVGKIWVITRMSWVLVTRGVKDLWMMTHDRRCFGEVRDRDLMQASSGKSISQQHQHTWKREGNDQKVLAFERLTKANARRDNIASQIWVIITFFALLVW